ncbi:DEAD/DEAH box helicase family protein [Desulfobacula sp.]|jgi:hypothetical protein|uniref:DEAD/DEAH box helicase family protein n=1 Tax=Desulfobacula sp. TaxID=2593537 RepID=UPI0039B8F13F|nr:DEAD/DEAH box helicase family protein [Desulfobacula sp.]
MARFDKKLILSNWMLKQFGVDDFSIFQDILADSNLIGFDEANISHFHHELVARHFPERAINTDTLLAYDENIVRHWRRITEKRNNSGNIIYPLYFQYLALLFIEHYLDRYFTDRTALCDDLNEHLEEFNENLPPREQLQTFLEKELNKIAIWIATGGGKTLIMHVNFHQFKHYQNKAGEKSFNKTILLTPNEGLSRQHETELLQSKIHAQLFEQDKQLSLFKAEIDIIDIHKLKEKKGEKTVAVDSFESNNLVLVDEGHRGASGQDWMAKRNQLCEQGFSFEYSATFGQAIKAASGSDAPTTERGKTTSKKYQLIQQYGKCILFDYSYKYFHKDGYGKDHLILNLDKERLDEQRQLYLTACLLSFYQQKLFFNSEKKSITNYLLAEPLWIFAGGKVLAQNMVNDDTGSDIQLILGFLCRFLHNKGGESIKFLELLFTKRDDLRNGKGDRIFSKAFPFINKQWNTDQATDLFHDILKVVFRAGSSGNMHVVHLKGSGGEIGLRVGENDFFGLVNIGDAASLIRLFRENLKENMVVTDQVFSSSFFQDINSKNSPINILVGAKKFTEGWSSWRVSTMGLMNVGRSEGSEIIQLFGRGVRLKGYDFSLKRSSSIPGMKHPKYLQILETLNVFGIRSNYMEEFEEYLKEEGVGESVTETIMLPVIKREFPDDLKLIRLKEDIPTFKECKRPWLEIPPEKFKSRVTLNWYPKIQARKSKGDFVDGSDTSFNEGRLNNTHLAFLNFEAIYFEIAQYKNEKAWYNLQISKNTMKELLNDSSWYRLLIPEEHLEIKDFKRIHTWHEIAVSLLKKYCERYYSFRKNEYEAPHLEYYNMQSSDDNFIEEYKATVNKSQEEWIKFLKEVEAKLTNQNFNNDMKLGNLKIFNFSKHLYQPLIYFSNNEILKISPVSLNTGEHNFVEDLKKYCTGNKDYFKNKELYLLRNQSKKGVAFFLEGNFYPDFILWIIDGDKQYVSFIDPKGLRNIHGFDDPKISFYKKVKKIESRLEDTNIILNSFIVSNTHYRDIKWWSKGSIPKQDFVNHHVLFQKDAQDTYISEIMKAIA